MTSPRPPGVTDVTLVYESCAIGDLAFSQVPHLAFETISRRIGELLKTQRALDPGSPLPAALRALRSYRFQAASLPLPFGHDVLVSTLSDFTAAEVLRLRRAYPDLEGHLADIEMSLSRLLASNDWPLLDRVMSIAANGLGRASVLLCSSARVASVQRFVDGLGLSRRIGVISEANLPDSSVLDSLVVIGSPQWFSEHVFNAPRTRMVHVVAYEWLNLGFDTALRSFRAGVSKPRSRALVIPRAIAPIENDDLVPKVDWQAVAVQYGRADRGNDEETVTAKLLVLEGDVAVMMDSAATCLAIGAEGESLELVRTAVSELQPGMFVLLRTTGGGDYVADVAEQLMGRQYVQAQANQARWKEPLRRLVNEQGSAQVVDLLAIQGASRANASNLRNWTSSRNIRPESDDDFRAILRVTRLVDSFERLWAACRAIDRAHRRAGFLIRRNLLKEVRRARPADLDRAGKFDFHLGDGNGGSLTAIRILSSDELVHDVPVAKLSRLFREGQ